MDDIDKNIDEYNSNKKLEILIIFHDMMADLRSSRKTNLIVAELFITDRKLNISLVFITQIYFAVPKTIRLNTTHYFIMKIPNKQELEQISVNHWSDIDFFNLYRIYTTKPYSFLVNDTLTPEYPLRFRCNLLERI